MQDKGSAWTKPFLEALAALFIILVCIFILYGPRWASGSSVFRGAIQEQYYLIGQYAFDHQIIKEFERGCFPLWNPLNALGTPLLGNMLSAVFYPLKALVYIFPGLAARDTYIVVRLLLAGLFTFALCRSLRLSFLSSLLGSFTFTFSGYMTSFVNENYLNADVLLPAAALLALSLRKRPRAVHVLLFGVTSFFVLNNGHPEAAFYTLLLPAYLGLVCPSGLKNTGRTMLVLGAGLTVGLLLSLPMMLPFIEYWARGYHFHVPGAGFFHYQAKDLVSLVSPWFFGKAEAGAAFLGSLDISWPAQGQGVPSYKETIVPWIAPSLGAAPLFMAALAGTRLRMLSRTDAALLVYALFFVGVMFGLPLFRWLGLLPVFSFSGNFKHPVPGVALCVAVLAGRGLDMVMHGQVRWVRVANLLLVSLVVVLFLGAIQPARVPFFNPYSAIVLLVLFMTGAWVAWFAFHSFTKQGESKFLSPSLRSVAGAVVVLASAALLLMDGFQKTMRDPGYEERMSGQAMDELLSLSPLSRVYISQDIAPPNLNIIFGLADIRVMDGINDHRLVKAVNRINGHTRPEGGTYWYKEAGYLQPRPEKISHPKDDPAGHPLMRLFGVKYALMGGPLPYNRTIEDVLSSARILAPGPEYVGRTRLPFNNGSAPGILQHPPSRIEWRFNKQGGPELPERLGIRLMPALVPEAIEKQTDGVWMTFSDGITLAYSRYLHPRLQKRDAAKPVDIEVNCIEFPSSCRKLRLYSLPGASRDYDQAGWSDFRAGGPAAFDKGPWTKIKAGRNWLYRNPEALPRVFLASNALRAEEDAALDVLAAGKADPREVVIISGDVDLADHEPGSMARGLPGVIYGVEYSSQRIVVSAHLWRPGWLVVSDLFYPGWRCRVDNEETRIMQADYCIRGVAMPEGDHTMEMVYEPASFLIGLFAALACAVSCLLIFFIPPLFTRP